MMVKFSTARLADIADIKGGKRLPANANLITTPTSHPYIRGKDIRDGKISFDDPMYVLDRDFEKIQHYTIDRGDVCITIVGNIGDVGITPPHLHRASLTENAVKLVNLRNDFDALFLMYALLGPDAQSQMKLSAAGAAQPKLGIYKVNEIKVPAPSLPVQRRIAGILSAYDELIENSQRRIRILETMARALYREWFVHFRFPGHEAQPCIPSPLGDIPQGWEVKPLFDLTKVNYGKNLPTKKLADDGPYPVYGAAKIIGRYTEYTREQRTIVCGCRGSVGEMQITQPQCYVTNNSFTFDPAQPDNFFWLFHALKDRGLRDVVGGAAQPQITLEGISSIELPTPPLSLRSRFQKSVSPLFEQSWMLDWQIQTLRRTRDLLLPRLLSGQVELKTETA